MAILLKSGGLFLHVPKTGGNWVSDVLEASHLVFAHVGGKHAGPPQLAPLDGLLQAPARYDRANRPLFMFCFVRHPLRWYESWFKMNVSRGWPEWASDVEVWNPSVELNGLGADTFDGFIRNVIDRRPGFLSRLYAFYAGDAHFVGRQERLVDDLITVLRFLRVAFDEREIRRREPANVGPRHDVGLAPSLLARLRHVEHQAFERYGYADEPDGAHGPEVSVPLSGSVHLTTPFHHATGFAWTAPVPHWARCADDLDHPRRSMLSLFEDGRPLGGPHAPHDDIGRVGGGRFSHWTDTVLFSASDNSDPNGNGRRYEYRWEYPAAPGATDLMAQAAARPSGVAS